MRAPLEELTQNLSSINEGSDEHYAKAYLEFVTDFVEQYPEIPELQGITIQKENDGSVNIYTKDGTKINEIIPPGWHIVLAIADNDFYIDASKKEIYIPEEINELGIFGQLAFVHELGHALDPDIIDRMTRSETAFRNSKKGKTPVEAFNAILMLCNAELENEVAATDYGKAIARLLQIPELYYDSFVEETILWYKYQNLILLSDALESVQTAGDLQNLPNSHSVFDPFSGTYSEITTAELLEQVGTIEQATELYVKYSGLLRNRYFETYPKLK